MLGIENPLVIDRLWKHQEPKVVDTCEGCEQYILEGQEIFEFTLDGQTILIHRDSDCAYWFISEVSLCKVAGE